ncbi:RHS repeat-associated core domain-containing protein [Burkholderia contaminans]|uniref:Rhs family protein n=1 Tax=Burkholderia contaminans TaxID=488447 RepID=A0A6P2Z8H3_9BURK|nr:RHS repeat-associated core domain-containing protein [Burkholderia contaminans]VWD28076.1 Rhs family protein [Burkholderia contaminans]
MSEFETRLTRASAPAESHASQSESKADTACDSLLGTVKSTFDPFKETFSSEGGTLHHVSEAVNSLASLQGMPSQLLNTGIAQIPLLDKMPGMPAATIGVPHLGTPHAHSHPPSSGFPLPSVGATIGSGCLSVLIGGIPAARVLDIGIAPTCGGITPFFDIQTGSSNTFIGGMRAARMGIDMTRHCNPMGHVGHSGGEAASAAEKGEEVASEAAQVTGRAKTLGRAGKAWSVGNAAVGPASGVAAAADDASQGEIAAAAMMAAQTAADLAFMALSNLMGKDPGIEPSMGALLVGDPTVLIGGFPLPDSQMMWHTAKHGIGKKVRARIAPERQEAGPCRDGHPVDVVRGTAENEFVDYVKVEVPEFSLERFYCSGWRDQDGVLGFGFRHGFQHELRMLRTRAIYVDARNRTYPFRRNAAGQYAGICSGYELEQRDGRCFVLHHERLGDMIFDRANDSDRVARLVRYVKSDVQRTLEYSRDGALMRITQEDCRAHQRQLIDFRYDDHGHVVELYLKDQEGGSQRIAHYRYDTAGCLVEVTNILGARTSHKYDRRRRMIQETDPNGYSFLYRYDNQDRCIESVGEDGRWRVVLGYQPGRTVVTRVDGGKWTFLYNEARTVTRIVDPYGGATERVTGDDGQILRETDSGGRVIRWLYDERGGNTGRLDGWGNHWPPREEALTLPNPLTHEIPATPLGLQWGDARPTDLVDRILLPPEIDTLVNKFASNIVVSAPTEQHDAAGNVIARTDEYRQTEYLHRDDAGNLLFLRDKDGCGYHNTITSWNLRESEADPLGNTIRYRHTAKGEIAVVIDATGNESAYTYDLKGRISRVVRHGVLRETYRYDEGDRLIEKCDGAGTVLLRNEVGFDGLCSHRVLGSGDIHTFAYDALGNVTEASTTRFKVTRTFDGFGRLTGDRRDDQGVEHRYAGQHRSETMYFGHYAVHYEEIDGRQILIRTPDGGEHRMLRSTDGRVLMQLANKTNVLYMFDRLGRATGRLSWQESRTDQLRSTQYAYSATGELQRVTDSVTGSTEYRYDAAHRLIGKVQGGLLVSRFIYDGAGNLLDSPTSGSMQYIEGNRLARAGGTVYEHDSRNHIVQATSETGCRRTYHYNSMDLLVKEQLSDRPVAWTADYDGMCRRVATTCGSQRTDFYWDGDRLAAEVNADGLVRLYVYANDMALVPFMFFDYLSKDAALDSGRAYFVFHDQVGMPQWIEDMDAKTVWAAEHTDPYGSIDVAVGSSIEYNLRFPGHYFDESTGLHSNRFRSYNPALGRYLQSDPLGQRGGINLYSYTANPLLKVDVLGLSADECKAGEHSSDGPGNTSTGHVAEQLALWGEPVSVHKTPPERPRLSREEGQRVVDGIHAAMRSTERANRTTGLTELEDGRLVITSNAHSLTPSQRAEAVRLLLNRGFGPDDVIFVDGKHLSFGYHPSYDKPVTEHHQPNANYVSSRTDRKLQPENIEASENLPDPSTLQNPHLHHAEQRGIEASYKASGRPPTRQWSSSGDEPGNPDRPGHGGAACRHCARVQQELGIRNETGIQPGSGKSPIEGWDGRIDRTTHTIPGENWENHRAWWRR